MGKYWPVFVVIFLGAAILAGILTSPEYIFDDPSHVGATSPLPQVKTFSDALHFQLQPSRPVSNLLLSLVQWGTGGGRFWQCLFSLILHGAVSVLIFIFARSFFTGPFAGTKALGAAALFFIHPLHVDDLAVVVFRWEILGTFFTLAALICIGKCQKEKSRRWGFLLFLSLGFAILSKEIFALIAPFAAFLYLHVANPTRRLKSVCLISLAILFWGLVGLYLVSQPTEFPYVGGKDYFKQENFLWLGARAMAEAGVALFSPTHLTTIRLSERTGLGYGWNDLICGAVYAVTILMGGLFFRQKGTLRFAGSLLCVVIVALSLIPNLNVGSQHYLYSAVFPAALLAAELSEKIYLRWPTGQRFLKLAGATYIVILLALLSLRVFETRSAFALAMADWEHYPQSKASARFVLDNLVFHERWDEVLPIVQASEKSFPETSYFRVVELGYYFARKDLAKAEPLYQRLTNEPLPRAMAAKIRYQMGVLKARRGACREALTLFDSSLSLVKTREAARSRTQISSLQKTNPERCN